MKGASVIPVKGDQKIVQELTRRLREALRDRLKRVIVYGSRARGDYEPDSDLDVLVVVSRLDVPLKRQIQEIRYQVMWEADFDPLISLLCLEEGEFESLVRQGISLAANIQREGCLIYERSG